MGSEMLVAPGKQEKMRSNFTQTCNRFSQFLKERRSFAHLDAFKSEAKDVSSGLSKKMENERVSLELFPFMSSSMAAGVESSSKNMTNSSELPKSKEEHKNTTTTPSMTIFYGGKVLVFDELPEDKAIEIMALASRGTINSQIRTQTQTRNLTQDVVPQGVSSLSDLPIARRVSLHRFMEKRKHRVASSAPYQLQSLYEKQQLELKL